MKKAFAYLCTGMYLNSRFKLRPLAYHSCTKEFTLLIQLMSTAVIAQRTKTLIQQKNFNITSCRRVALLYKNQFHICIY